MKKWLLLFLFLLLTGCGAAKTAPELSFYDSCTVVRELPAVTDGPATLYAVTLKDRAAYDRRLSSTESWWKDPLGIYVFRCEGAPDTDAQLWYPWLYEGKIHEIYWTSRQAPSSFLFGKSLGGDKADALHAVAPLTSEKTPLFLVIHDESVFGVIGETAYLLDEAMIDPAPETLPALEADGLALEIISFDLET